MKKKGLTATDIARLLIRKKPKDGKDGEDGKDDYAQKQKILEESSEIRLHVCSNMIGNTICADLLDYIYRDWYHVGRPRSPEDRIFHYMEIRRPKRNDGALPITEAEAHKDDRFVISLGEKTKIRTDGVSAILGLLEWRYELGETVLFHRTKLAAGAMLDRALFELWGTDSEGKLVSKLLSLSDDQLIDEALKEAEHTAGDSEKTPSLDAAISLLRKLRHRALFKELATFDHSNLQEPHITHIKRHYAGLDSPTKAAAGFRTQAARHLEFDFVLPAGSIAIYCAHVNPKIAEVSVDVDGEIMAFNKYEEQHNNRLSGGHLQAQIRRFEHLWRLYFFIDDEVKKSLSDERLRHLHGFIRDVVLCYEGRNELVRRAKDEAVLYVHLNYGIELEPITFARSDPTVSRRDYPNGAPRLRSFIRQQQMHREEG